MKLKGINRIKREKALLQWRDSQACEDCGAHKNLTLHHVNPKSNGGKTTKNNLIVLCRTCHNQEHEGKAKEGRSWEEREIYDLVELKKSGYTYEELADMFGRTESACQTMIHNIKLKVDKVSMKL